MSLASPRGQACHWSPPASFIIHDSTGGSTAAGAQEVQWRQGQTGLVTTGWENSLGLIRKGPSKDFGQGCPLLSLSLPNLEGEFNLVY